MQLKAFYKLECCKNASLLLLNSALHSDGTSYSILGLTFTGDF